TMADVNVNAPAEQTPAMAPPTRTDDQILSRIRWVPVGKSNCYLDVERLKAAKQSKPLAPKAAPITKPAAVKASKSQQPKSAPAKPQEKKRKLVTESSEAPSLAKRSKAGKNEPRLDDEEADLQKAVEESLKDVHAAHQGPLLPVVIRELESGKFQPLPEVQGKGKEKVGEEQAIQVLLNLQTPKKKSPADQYIFQRRNSTPTEPSCHDESSSLYAELGLIDSETEFDEEVPGIDVGDQDEGQAGPNPGIQDEGQAGSNPGDVAVSQPQPSHVVHAGPNLEHMDIEENLKLPAEDQVRLEEPTNSAGTLSFLKNLAKEFSFTNQFLEEKSQEDEPEKTNTELEVQSMVTVPIHQDTSSVPLMTTLRIGELEQHMADLLQDNLALEERLDKHRSRLYKLENLDIPHQVSKAVDEIITDAVDWAIQAPLRNRFKDLPEADMKEILHHCIWESNSYKAHEDHKKLCDALEKSMDRPFGTSGTSRAFGSSQLPPPPPPPPSTNQSDQSISTAAPSSSKTAASAEYTAWITTDIRLKPSVSSIPEDLHMDDDTALDE
ncbi:E-beta-farnesene synthase, partial [Tanacetum coccineum]